MLCGRKRAPSTRSACHHAPHVTSHLASGNPASLHRDTLSIPQDYECPLSWGQLHLTFHDRAPFQGQSPRVSTLSVGGHCRDPASSKAVILRYHPTWRGQFVSH